MRIEEIQQQAVCCIKQIFDICQETPTLEDGATDKDMDNAIDEINDLCDNFWAHDIVRKYYNNFLKEKQNETTKEMSN